MQGRRFVTTDVFTDTRFGGNPLAVVLDAEGLTDDEMQAIAREFNLSETTFVLPPEDTGNTAHVRIFTPGRELPFAGHPNVGTAFVLAQEGSVFGREVGGDLKFEEAAGIVPIELLKTADQVTGARLTAPQAFSKGAEVSLDQMAASVGLTPDDIDVSAHPPVLGSAGMVFPIAKLTGMDALRRARPVGEVLARDPEMQGHVFIYTQDDAAPGRINARMFAPVLGIPEDPATGGAAAALTGLLGSLKATDGTYDFRVTQGVEMGRPSLIETSVDVLDGQVTAVRVGGQCVPVMAGEITV